MGEKKTKKSTKPKHAKVNPFELKFNRVKHDVMGKKKASLNVGHPSLSKKRAIEKREVTLAVESENINKVNKIVDRRIGEKDTTMSAEEKAIKRFAAERAKGFQKGNKFNLNDDIDNYDDDELLLTHKGQSLTSVQKYDRTAGSDSEEDGDISADIVARAHFGGGMPESLDVGEQGKQGGERHKTRQEILADLILKSKTEKQNKQDEKDRIEEKTDRLDDKFRNLLLKLQSGVRTPGSSKHESTSKDDYDKMLLDMKLAQDKRGTAVERVKTEEEQAAEDNERLRELERQRIARMNTAVNKKSTHISADEDLDIFKVGKKNNKEAVFVRFNDDGKMVGGHKIEKPSIKQVIIDSESEDESEKNDENDEDLEDILGDSEKGGGCSNETAGMEEEEGEEDEENSDEDDSEEEEDSDQDEDEEDVEEKVPTLKKNMVRIGNSEGISESDSSIPFVFEMPKNYEALMELLGKYPASAMGTILDRLIKCHHPSLKEGNKARLARLMVFVLRLYNELGQKTPTQADIEQLGALIQVIYKLNKFDVEYGARCLRALIRQLWKERQGKKRRHAPRFNLIGTIRLVASLFPVSDAWHPVCTPMLAVAAHTLSQCLVSSVEVLSRQLLLATILADYVDESKRLIPEVLAFLRGALVMAVADDKDRPPSNVFPTSEPHRHMLVVEEDISSIREVQPLRLSEVFNEEDIGCMGDSSMLRARIVRALIAIIQKYSLIYSSHSESYRAMFGPICSLISRLPISNLPATVAEEANALLLQIRAECRRTDERQQMGRVRTEQKMLKMLEPVFEENFDPERPRLNRDSNRKGKAAEIKRMNHMLKQEQRGAIKELRKDSAFLAKRQRDQQLASDAERKAKVRRIMTGLQGQQHEMTLEKISADAYKKKVRNFKSKQAKGKKF